MIISHIGDYLWYNLFMKKIVTGILAHVDAGKTTLSEALLYESGMLKKLGRVDNRDSFLDTFESERLRGITIFSKTARFAYKDTEIVMIDTPGHVDFSAETERALLALDEAILLINAGDGVQAHTKTLWKLLRERKIPTFIFVNKMDLYNADKAEVLCHLKKELSGDIVDFTDTGSDIFYEEAATASEELLNSYMETGKIDDGDLRTAVSNSRIFPVYFGSALKNTGIKEFLEGFVSFSTEGKPLKNFSALCIKITRDKAGNRLTWLKLLGGSLKVKDELAGEKINEIRLYSGEKYESVKELSGTDVCAVTGLKNSAVGKTYGEALSEYKPTLEPVLTYAVIYPKEVDAVTMHRNLKELEAEEPSLGVSYNEATGDIFVNLFGDVQTEILTGQIEKRFGIKVSFGTGRILYKETISDTVEGVGHFEPLRHYAEVHLRLEPLPLGEGLKFDTEVSENDLALNWQRLVLTHLNEKVHKGVLTGSPITDMKITLVAGKAHLKHTEGGDFRQATYRAVRQGLMMAESVLLEPFYDYELTVPNTSVGRAMNDIDRMWGSAVVTKQTDKESVIEGRAPVATLNGYATEVSSYTKGLGRLSLSLSGYGLCHNPEEVISARMYSPEGDVRNPADSVFTSGGSSNIIPWNEVYKYMHLPLSFLEKENGLKSQEIKKNPERLNITVTTEEVDDIIKKASFSNQNGREESYKGISRELLEKRRVGGRKEEKPVIYKGTKETTSFLLIDGYNVVHAWKELAGIAERDINAAAGRLIDIVSNYAAMTGYQTILVFDAYRVPGHSREVINYHNICVVYTEECETADRYIERYAHANAKKKDVSVITSDGVEQVIIRGEGCRLMSSRDFEADYLRRTELLKESSLGEGIRISSDE